MAMPAPPNLNQLDISQGLYTMLDAGSADGLYQMVSAYNQLVNDILLGNIAYVPGTQIQTDIQGLLGDIMDWCDEITRQVGMDPQYQALTNEVAQVMWWAQQEFNNS